MDRADVIREVAIMIQSGASVAMVMPKTIELCNQVELSAAWDQIASIDWQADMRHCQHWFARLLTESAPGPIITGFWFGIFNPIRDGQPSSDFYVVGSADYPSEGWFFDQEWIPSGRYAFSRAQAEIYQHGRSAGSEVSAVADYVLTFAHAAATVNGLLAETDRTALLGGASTRGVAVGHDSGDALFLAEVTPTNIDRSASDWV